MGYSRRHCGCLCCWTFGEVGGGGGSLDVIFLSRELRGDGGAELEWMRG